MKKQLIPLFVLTSLMAVSCTTTGIVNSSTGNPDPSAGSNHQNPSNTSDKSSEYSSLFNQNNGNANLIKAVPQPARVDYSDLMSEGFQSFLSNFNNFNSSFTEDYLKDYFDGSRNDTISPLSIYFAMAQAGATTAGDTQKEIFDALNVSYEDAIKYSPILYKAANKARSEGNKTVAIEEVNNSIWLEKSYNFKQSGVDTLVDSFFCEPYAANFSQKPREVSKIMSDYISDKTRGLIKPDLDFDDLVRMVIVNTLYMKDQWLDSGDDLKLEDTARDFTNYDGSKTKKNLLLGSYNEGRKYVSEDFTSFKITTNNFFTIKFMIPNEGKKLDDIFTQKNILEMHNVNYGAGDNKNYRTRCIFPEFTASAVEDLDLVDLFKKRGVSKFFTPGADFSNIVEDGQEELYCSDIKHLTKLIVDKKGVEGAAVTIIAEKATSVGPIDEPIYEDFIIDKAFGFEISDYHGIPLFTGVVNKI